MSSNPANKDLQITSTHKSSANAATQKRKRPRQRCRKRNKGNISANASIAVSDSATESSTQISGLEGDKKCVHQIPKLNGVLVHKNSSLKNIQLQRKSEENTERLLDSSQREEGYLESTIDTELNFDTSPKKSLKCLRVPFDESTLQVKNQVESESYKVASGSAETDVVSQDIDNSAGRKEALQEIRKMLTKQQNPPVVSLAVKSREEIMAEREAKKIAKQAKKIKALGVGETITSFSAPITSVANPQESEDVVEIISDKTREQIKAERDAKKKSKQALKLSKATGVPKLAKQLKATNITEVKATTIHKHIETEQMGSIIKEKRPALTKAERRAQQESQRAIKAQALTQRNSSTLGTAKLEPLTVLSAKSTIATTEKATFLRASSSSTKCVKPVAKSSKTNACKVRLFNHLDKTCQEVSLFLNNPHIHPSVARLGEQYAQRTVVGSNARCIAFLNALKMVIREFETPPKKEFARSLETIMTKSVDHLHKCRPLAVSVSNAYKHIKHVLTQLPTDQPESDLKVNLCRFIDTYIENQIGKAAEAISYSVQEKISNDDVILTFGCSSLINYIFEEAQHRRVDFRVIVVDSRPFCEGQELLRRLIIRGIPCSYVLINAISFVMPEATKVLLGAHALLANGYVMARTGTAQVALVAHSFNVPVLVCCETHKFSERSQTDAIVYNELGNPDELIRSDKCSLANWETKEKMSPLNLMYDITPPELVTAVVTEVSILPCTSVPVILRIKPTEIGY